MNKGKRRWSWFLNTRLRVLKDSINNTSSTKPMAAPQCGACQAAGTVRSCLNRR